MPCAGSYSFAEVLANAKNLEFKLSSQDFGTGRAGQNLVGSDGNKVLVVINAQSALNYTNLPNGAIYLVAHEIAHSLNSMQQYNNQLWQQYVSRSDDILSQDQLVAAYPDSPEFAAGDPQKPIATWLAA